MSTIDELRQLAESCDADAQVELGRSFASGSNGATQDFAEAFRWFRKAAEHGNAVGQYNLGVCYASGCGVTADMREGVKWFRAAAEQGDALAQFNLGRCFENGWAVNKDLNEATKWYHKAAKQGNKDALQSISGIFLRGNRESVGFLTELAHQGDDIAQLFLGERCERGPIFARNPKEAVQWYGKAAKQGNREAVRIICQLTFQRNEEAFQFTCDLAQQGDADAQHRLGWCCEVGFGVTQDFHEAIKWHRKSAEQGSADAQVSLGVCYNEGKGVEEDLNEAIKWYRLAAEQGNSNGQNNLGRCYANGWGVTKDLNEAVKLYRMAAEQGDADAQHNLAVCHKKGWGVTKDLTEAVKWYRLAAEQGNAKAQCELGACYHVGNGVTKNINDAVKWYRLAAEQGNADAQCKLGECCENSWGVKKEINQAVKWYCKAAEQGSTDAFRRIESLVWGGNKEAFNFFSQLAQQGNEKMQIFVAECCKNGRGVKKNLDEAVKWYRMAAEQGNKDALKSILELTVKGKKAAWESLLALAQQNHIEAQNMVGCCFEKGKGVSRNVNEAISWYRKAAEQGDKKALENVRFCIEYGNKDAVSCISPSTAAELSFREASPLLPIASFQSSVTNPTGLILSPDDKLVVIFRNGKPEMIVMFEALTGKEKWRQQNSSIRPKAFSPDGNFLLVHRRNSPTVAILDANTGTLVRELSGHTEKVNTAAWSSSNLIATGSDDKTIRISHPDGTLVRVLTGHEAEVIYLAFGSDANRLFSHSQHDYGVHLWDVATGAFRSIVDESLNFAKISPDGSLIASDYSGGLLFFKSIGREYLSRYKSFDRTLAITWSPDSKHLFAKDGRTLHIFQFTKEGLLCTSFHHSTEISAMAISADGDRAVTIDSEGRVQQHLCLLENSLPRAPIKITASQFPLSALPLFIPKQSHSLQEALDRTRVLIERTLLPTSLQNLQRVLQCINESSVSDISTRVRTENAIEDMFAQVCKFVQSEAHLESAHESLKQPIAAIESAMQTLLSDNSSVSLPTSLSSFSSSESNVLFAEDSIAHVVPAALSKAELDVILRFSHSAYNKLHALEKVLSVRAASFEEAIVEYDHFSSELQAKGEGNSEEFTELVAQMKEVIDVISASDVGDVHAMDASTSNKESNKNGIEIVESGTSKSAENNESTDKSNEDDDDKEVENSVESMTLLHEIRIPLGKVNDVKISPDRNILAIANDAGLFVFDTRSKVELWKITSWTWHIAFSPTSMQLAAAIETEKDVVIFEVPTGARVFTFAGGRGEASKVAWSNSNLIASSHRGNPSILVRHPDGKFYGKYYEDTIVADLSFSLDSTRLAVATHKHGFLIIELSNQDYDQDDGCFRFVPEIVSEGASLFRTSFSPDGTKVAYTSWHGAISVLDTKTFETTNTFRFSGCVDISWSRNSRFIVAISPGDHRNEYFFFKILATDGNQFGEGVFQQKIFGDRVAFSPDGSEIITVDQKTGLVQFWMSPLFITLTTQSMPSADNDEIPFGEVHVIPSIDTQAVEHLFDRTSTLIDRTDHPESFRRLVTLLHHFRNVSATLKISESDADFLVIDSSSSSSSSSQQPRIRNSTFQSVLDFVNVNGRKLLELENKLLCQADMFSKALIEYDRLVDEIRIASEQHIDKIAGFIAYLNKPPISADRLFHIKSVINSITHEVVNQTLSNAADWQQ